jgi:hypothetical protein
MSLRMEACGALRAERARAKAEVRSLRVALLQARSVKSESRVVEYLAAQLKRAEKKLARARRSLRALR